MIFERHKRNLLNSISNKNPQESYIEEKRIRKEERQADSDFRKELDNTIQRAMKNIFKDWK